MKITIEHYNEKYSVEIPEDSDLSEFMEVLKRLCVFVYNSNAESYFA